MPAAPGLCNPIRLPDGARDEADNHARCMNVCYVSFVPRHARQRLCARVGTQILVTANGLSSGEWARWRNHSRPLARHRRDLGDGTGRGSGRVLVLLCKHSANYRHWNTFMRYSSRLMAVKRVCFTVPLQPCRKKTGRRAFSDDRMAMQAGPVSAESRDTAERGFSRHAWPRIKPDRRGRPAPQNRGFPAQSMPLRRLR